MSPKKPLSSSWTPALLALALTTWSQELLACPSCVDPRDANADAFIGSTIALSIIPLAFIVGVVVYVVRAERAAVADNATLDAP